MDELGWWTISGEEFLHSMHRAANGESPDLIYAELYANSEVTRPAEEDEDGEVKG